MLIKLAARNVKRQLGNYLIYFITVTLTVAVMFSLCNLIYSEQLMSYAHKIEELMSGITAITIFVAIIVALVLGYATSFMLRLRKREFGTYLTLGLRRKNILLIFIVENLIICMVALCIGILLGLLIFQALMGLIANLIDINISFAAYSVEGLLLTIALVLGMFMLSSIASAIYLKRVKIYNLIYLDKEVKKKVKHPIFWFAIAVIAFALIVGSLITFYNTINMMLMSAASDSENEGTLYMCMLVFSISIILFHIGAARGLMNILLKNKRLKAKGTNTFLLRQLSSELGSNSILCGILAFLIVFSVIGANVSFGQKTSSDEFLNHSYPFDISIDITDVGKSPYTREQVIDKIQNYSDIKEFIPYNIYEADNGYLHSFTPWTGEGYAGLNDMFIKESDFNKLITRLGYKEIKLNDEFLILSIVTQAKNCDFSNARLNIKDNIYTLSSVEDKYPILTYGYFIAVVPDKAVSDMKICTEYEAIDLANTDYDCQSLYDELAYEYKASAGYNIMRSSVSIREYYELEESSMSALLIVGQLYISIVFVFMAIAILILKLLSGITEDRRKYYLLYQIGVSKQEESKTLFKQLSVFFIIPYLIPILMSIPVAFLCGRLVELAGYGMIKNMMYSNALVIALIITAIYVLYFIATYAIEKRNVIRKVSL